MSSRRDNWQPIHRAAKMLNVDRPTLYRMRDSETFKLGKHYGAGPMTRSRDSYYWNVPLVEQILKQQQENQTVSAA